MKLYKYLNPDCTNKVFPSREHVTFKCTYPKDFNDPYELFLAMDLNEQPEVLAFYSEVIGEIPQIPTTCFSKSPAVVPMWSHYAQNLQGFVIEVDEEKLIAHFTESGLGDVDYQDEPNDSIRNDLYRAYTTLKGRHTYILQNEVMSAAYYTKCTCWSYELERRMVTGSEETRVLEDQILIDIPVEFISAIICGPRADKETQKFLREKAKDINCGYFELRIGRNSSIPFFTDLTGNPYIFMSGAISPSQRNCVQCKEPLRNDAKKCTWCMIDEEHRISAAERNPYRIYDSIGMLDSYLDSMEKIRRKHRKV